MSPEDPVPPEPPDASRGEPVLAPPGAGLPRLERWVARAYFRFAALSATREQAAAVIGEELFRMERLVQRCAVGQGARRVLIPRLRGMEDSSRNWSVFMTAAHVRMVNDGIREILAPLLAGGTPTRVADPAAVKPDPRAGADELRKLNLSCALLLQVNRQAPTLRTKVRHAHPWFGALNAHEWFFLAGFHMALHRAQMEQIMEGLKSAPPRPADPAPAPAPQAE